MSLVSLSRGETMAIASSHVAARTGWARLVHGTFAGEEVVVLSFPAPSHLCMPSSLSECEGDVVRLVLGGASNAEVARQRQVSQRTVANQLSSVYKKLGVSSRYDLIRAVASEAMHGAEPG